MRRPSPLRLIMLETLLSLTLLVHRSAMGKLELRRLHLHPLLWHSP